MIVAVQDHLADLDGVANHEWAYACGGVDLAREMTELAISAGNSKKRPMSAKAMRAFGTRISVLRVRAVFGVDHDGGTPRSLSARVK